MPDNSFAFFPFLKTTSPVKIGRFEFRATTDLDGLAAEDELHVRRLSRMLFVQDHYRIRTATYAVVPRIDLDTGTPETAELENTRAAVAYIYSAPHPTHGSPFLSSEHASLVIFTPSAVSEYLVRPEFNVEPAINDLPALEADNFRQVSGYSGLYNFRHTFWVTEHSRLYGPKPHLVLNHSQDLALELLELSDRIDYQLLLALLERRETPTARRVFTALKWLTAANDSSSDDAMAILNLSVAFEALLKLPFEEKTDRFVDSISLLVGRIPRVREWADQFYAARSQVVHEGRVDQPRFVTSRRKGAEPPSLYAPLLSYGRQIFRLCLGALLMGADLAERAGLEEKLVSNQERFVEICTTLGKPGRPPDAKLRLIAPIVAAVGRYRFVAESEIKLETVVGAVKLAATALIESGEAIAPALAGALRQVTASERASDHLTELAAIEQLERELSSDSANIAQTSLASIVRDLVGVVWGYAYMYYYWSKQRQERQ